MGGGKLQIFVRVFSYGAVTFLLLTGCAIQADRLEMSPSTPAGAISNGNFTPTLSGSFDEPWSTNASRREMIETALFKLFNDLDSIRNDDCEIKPEIFIGDPMLEEHRYLLEEISTGMINSFCDYLTNDIPVIAGKYTFAKEIIDQEGLASDQYGGNCGFDLQQDYASACAIGGTAWVGISLGSVREGVSFIEERRLTIAAHELFHIIHDQINPRADPLLGTCRSRTCSGPVWFYEGAGEFFGRAMTQYLGLQNYATFVPTDRSGYYMDGEYLSDLEFLTESGKRAGGVENYYSGQVAMELIIANKGLLPLMEVWANLDVGMPFPEAFEMALGIPLEDFYDVFGTLHDRLYEEGGYCDSKVGCSAWNKPTERPEFYTDNPDEQQSSQAAGEQSFSLGIDESCLAANELWWSNCTELELGIPQIAENSDHGYPTDYQLIPKIESCDDIESIGFDIQGWAVSFEARAVSGAIDAFVSTQHYAANRHLDTDLDGVICSSQISN